MATLLVRLVSRLSLVLIPGYVVLSFAKKSVKLVIDIKTKSDKCSAVLAIGVLMLWLKFVRCWSSSVALCILPANYQLELHVFLNFIETSVESSGLITDITGFTCRLFPFP